MVYRIYVEKKEGFDHEAKKLLSDAREILGVADVENIRILNRYDVEDIEANIFRKCVKTVFSHPQTEIATEGAYGLEGARVFAVERLPDQFDQRADSAAQGVRLVSMDSRPVVRTAKVYAVYGKVTEAGLAAIKHYVINPVESREASLVIPDTLKIDSPVSAEAGNNQYSPDCFYDARAMKSDIEIAQEAKLEHISRIAAKVNLTEDEIEYYGKYKAKIDLSVLSRENADGKLVLVTAITPTPAGEGKTTTTIGLADGLKNIGGKVVVALREPSLGPVFGIKGGAAGGGYAQVVPMEDINLHFTGDFHAIGAANNLLAAMLDNHIFQGNEFGIDPEKITWRRCVDMNDRQLRNVQDGLGGGKNGVPRKDGYDITVASEIMAVLCLATSLSDLKARLSRIVVGYTYAGMPVTAGDLKAAGAMCALLKDALKPNLVQTLEGTPALVHGGPFANIAHGCNSVVATKTALKLGDYVITEAGFGADLGAEKFLDIKCRFANLKPAAVVIVATVRALKMHGGLAKTELAEENLPALEKGLPNLLKHVSNITNVYKLPAVVAVNRFPTDTDAEIALVIAKCRELGVNVVLSTVWAAGGKGGEALAKEVVRLCEQENHFTYCYDEKLPIKDKIHAVVTKIYGGAGVEYTEEANAQIARLEELGFGETPVCMAKTQYSFSDDASLLGAPEGFTVTVRSVKVSAGAGFVVVLTGNILTMPGLPKVPAANNIDVDENGKITGLF